MTPGKKICKTLKEIRQQIAKNNDIALITSECHYKGECKGTCPKCEAEVMYLEDELIKRRQLGKAVAIAGISLGILGSFTGCSIQQKANKTHSHNKIVTDSITPINHKSYNFFNNNDDDYFVTEGIIVSPEGFDFDNSLFDVYRFVEEMPEPIGGFDAMYKFLQEKLKYPEIDTNRLNSGTVFVEFIVEEDGSISNVKVLAGISPELDEEAVRVVKMMPNWNAGKRNGELVRCFFSLPIKFSNKM